MAKENYSNQVCELLAKQLVEEQAEMMKHEAVINNIKQAIVDKKVEVIKNKLHYRGVKYDGGVYYLAEINSHIEGTKFIIEIGMLVDPKSITKDYTLSPREKDLLQEYKERYLYYSSNLNSYHEEIRGMMRKMYRMKNSIILLAYFHHTFNFDEAIEPDFFKKTGFTTGRFKSYTTHEETLEDCIVNVF